MQKADPLSPTDVIIVNFNAGDLLTDCVRSALTQDVETVIVSDNGSSDESLLTLESAVNDPRLVIVRNGTNLGFAAGCNIGIKHSTACNLLFLNPDCQLGTDALKILTRALHADARTGMVGGFLRNMDGSEQRGGRRNLPTPSSAFGQLFGARALAAMLGKAPRRVDLAGTPLPSGPVEVEAISGACMLVKSEAIKDVGTWDEDYFLHCEDLDWCKRFGLSGWNILFVPGASIHHVKGASGRVSKAFVEWHKHRGMLIFYDKFYRRCYSRPVMWLVTLGVWCHFALVLVRNRMQTLASRRLA